MSNISKQSRRILTEGLGWLLVVLGIAALILPGPGLLILFAGVALLSTQYAWAERRLDKVRAAAYKTATESVKTWPRIIFSILFTLTMLSLGIYWGLQPAVPDWWPLSEELWLAGGWGTGSTIIASALIALSMVIFSFFRFRGKS